MNDRAIERATKAVERIALVLAALYADRLGDMKQGEKAERLSRLGFSNAQIADSLGSSKNSINVSRVKLRRTRRGTLRSPKRKVATSRGKGKKKNRA